MATVQVSLMSIALMDIAFPSLSSVIAKRIVEKGMMRTVH